jgi:hypothetical protein
MKTKVIRLLDRATDFYVLCVDMNPDPPVSDARGLTEIAHSMVEQNFLQRYGHSCDGKPNIGMTHLTANGFFTNDPYGWKNVGRTYTVAHNYIIDHWDELVNGATVDVELILGEKQPDHTSAEPPGHQDQQP